MPKNRRTYFSLSSAYIELLHDEFVPFLWPGTDPVARNEYRDEALLASAAARPFQTVFGKEAYPTTLGKAAAIFHSLIANHPFHNGNKRTAVVALDHFLLANDFYLIAEEDTVYELAKATAMYRERGMSHAQILADISDTLEGGGAVPLPFLKEYYAPDFYRSLLRIRRFIRGHPLNRQKAGL